MLKRNVGVKTKKLESTNDHLYTIIMSYI